MSPGNLFQTAAQFPKARGSLATITYYPVTGVSCMAAVPVSKTFIQMSVQLCCTR